MEEIVTCNICMLQYDNSVFIPRVLECGHTFCSPCITKIIEENSICPKCRAVINGEGRSLPINYLALEVLDVYQSKDCSTIELVTSIKAMKEKCLHRIDILRNRIISSSKSLEVLNKCMEKLEELTESESHKIDAKNTKNILNELEEDFKKTDDAVIRDDIKSFVSISMSNFENSEEYLSEIFKRVQNKEKVFAIHKVNDKIQYGEVSTFENRLLFHCLVLSEVPKDSSLLLFEDLKQCGNQDNFIKICCNDQEEIRMLIIKMKNENGSHHFSKLCTGEYGPSYKGSSFGNRVKRYGKTAYIMNVNNFVENGRSTSRAIDYILTEYSLLLWEENTIYLDAYQKAEFTIGEAFKNT